MDLKKLTKNRQQKPNSKKYWKAKLFYLEMRKVHHRYYNTKIGKNIYLSAEQSPYFTDITDQKFFTDSNQD